MNPFVSSTAYAVEIRSGWSSSDSCWAISRPGDDHAATDQERDRRFSRHLGGLSRLRRSLQKIRATILAPAVSCFQATARTRRWSLDRAAAGNARIVAARTTAPPQPTSRASVDHLRRAGSCLHGRSQPFKALTADWHPDGDAAVSQDHARFRRRRHRRLLGLIICSATCRTRFGRRRHADGRRRADLRLGARTTAGGANPPIGKQAQASYAETGTNVYTICARCKRNRLKKRPARAGFFASAFR